MRPPIHGSIGSRFPPLLRFCSVSAPSLLRLCSACFRAVAASSPAGQVAKWPSGRPCHVQLIAHASQISLAGLTIDQNRRRVFMRHRPSARTWAKLSVSDMIARSGQTRLRPLPLASIPDASKSHLLSSLDSVPTVHRRGVRNHSQMGHRCQRSPRSTVMRPPPGVIIFSFCVVALLPTSASTAVVDGPAGLCGARWPSSDSMSVCRVDYSTCQHGTRGVE